MTVGPMFQMLCIVPLVCLARRIRTQVKNPGSVRHVRKDLHGVLALYRGRPLIRVAPNWTLTATLKAGPSHKPGGHGSNAVWVLLPTSSRDQEQLQWELIGVDGRTENQGKMVGVKKKNRPSGTAQGKVSDALPEEAEKEDTLCTRRQNLKVVKSRPWF
ncbi:hypothetical protein GW17_00000476 [Ensete ventricosum]|nr:hypothetical protein GW17_00000476 [Ensete ventricosum]